MEKSIVLAGPTLDRALDLVRLGLLSAKPADTQMLTRENCTGSSRCHLFHTKGEFRLIEPLVVRRINAELPCF